MAPTSIQIICSKIFLTFIVISGTNTETKCKFKDADELFLQWSHPEETWPITASGWYTYQTSTCEYLKNSSMEAKAYVFLQEDQAWRLVSWKGSVKDVLVSINDSLDNFVELEGVKNMTEESHSLSVETYDVTDSGNETINLKIYQSKKCSCQKVVDSGFLTQTEFTRLDLSNLSYVKDCEFLMNHRDLMPQEYIDLLNSLQFPENETLSDNEEEEKLKRWKPEFYVSKDCKVAYYHPHFDMWYVDYDDMCTRTMQLYKFFWSLTFVPCMENLPPAKDQQWIHYRKLLPYESQEYVELQCFDNDGFKRDRKYDFSLTCVSKDDEV